MASLKNEDFELEIKPVYKIGDTIGYAIHYRYKDKPIFNPEVLNSSISAHESVDEDTKGSKLLDILQKAFDSKKEEFFLWHTPDIQIELGIKTKVKNSRNEEIPVQIHLCTNQIFFWQGGGFDGDFGVNIKINITDKATLLSFISDLKHEITSTRTISGKPRLLLIDDDKFLLNMYKTKFEKAGMEVEALLELESDFVTQIANIRPSLIISDLIRPKVDGLQVLEALRVDDRTKNLPFVFLSNSLNGDSLVQAKRLGISGHIVKAEMIPSEVTERIVDILFAEGLPPENNSASMGYRRGVFVLVRKLSSGADSYITFQYRNPTTRKIMPGFHLAIFNELQYANWYLVNMKEDMQEGAGSDMPADGDFFIFQILDQKTWDTVRRVVLADGAATGAIINPCEETKTHRCPITLVSFDQYTDFNELKEVFSKYPNQHVTIKDERIGPNDSLILKDPTKIEV